MNEEQSRGVGKCFALPIVLVLYGLFIIVSSAVAYGEVTQNGLHWIGGDVVGPVRSLREEEVQLRREGTDWIEGQPTKVLESTFDRDRTIWEVRHLKPLPVVRSARCFVRGNDDRILQSFICDTERRSIDETRWMYRYNSDGNLIEETAEKNSGQNTTVVILAVYEYDSTGQRVTSRLYDSEGKLSAIITFHLDREKARLTVHATTADGDVQAKEVHTLDSMGRATEVVSFDHEGKVLSRTRLSYDEQGKRIERVFAGQGGEVREIDKYEYDGQGNWTMKLGRKITPIGEQRSIVRRVIEYFPSSK